MAFTRLWQLAIGARAYSVGAFAGKTAVQQIDSEFLTADSLFSSSLSADSYFYGSHSADSLFNDTLTANSKFQEG